MPAFFGLDNPEALAARPVEIVGCIACSTQSDLHNTVTVNQLLLDHSTKKRPVGDLLAKHDFVDVSMSVDVDYAKGTLLLSHGAQYRQHDGVVAPQCQRTTIVSKNLVVSPFDDLH